MTNIARNNVGYGLSNALQQLAPLSIISQRDPTENDIAELGTNWINKATDTPFIITSVVAGKANWATSPASGGGDFTDVTVDPGDLTVTDGDVIITAGNLSLGAGNAVIAGDLTVDGTTTFNGEFDLTSSSAITLTSTDNGAQAIYLHANGGTSETVEVRADQGTGDQSVYLLSDVGGVTLSGGKAAATAINITASNAAGGITATTGTGGIALTATNGAIAIASGTGAITVGNDAAAHTITIGNVTGATGIVESVGTGNFSLDGVAGSTYTVGASTTTGTIAIGGTAQTGAMTLGSSSGTNIVNVGTGTGATTVNMATGATNAKTVNIGTGAVANVITMGNATGATSVVLNVGTGALNVGTTATAHATNVGSTTAGATLVLNTPTGTYVAAANGVSVSTAGRGISLPGSILILSGAGSPNTVVTAAVGSLFLRTDPAGATSRAYINTDGSTAWTNITCAG